MKITSSDIDLSAYLALNEVFTGEADAGISEDVASKMSVHARKLKETNPNFVLRL